MIIDFSVIDLSKNISFIHKQNRKDIKQNAKTT